MWLLFVGRISLRWVFLWGAQPWRGLVMGRRLKWWCCSAWRGSACGGRGGRGRGWGEEVPRWWKVAVGLGWQLNLTGKMFTLLHKLIVHLELGTYIFVMLIMCLHPNSFATELSQCWTEAILKFSCTRSATIHICTVKLLESPEFSFACLLEEPSSCSPTERHSYQLCPALNQYFKGTKLSSHQWKFFPVGF